MIKKILLVLFAYWVYSTSYFLFSSSKVYKELKESKRKCTIVTVKTFWTEGSYRICKYSDDFDKEFDLTRCVWRIEEGKKCIHTN